MSAHEFSDKSSIVLEILVRRQTDGQPSAELAEKAAALLTDRGFKIIAKSSMGLSVIAEKELVERVFSTKIILKTADAGTTTGHHGTMAVIFETSPVIPHEFEFCIESVKLPSPIVPL